MDLLIALLIAGMLVGSLYGLLGFSLTLMYRTTGVLSFAHAGFALVGSYLYAGFECPVTEATSQCGTKPILEPLPAAIVTVVITTLLAVIIERIVIRPLARAPAMTRSLATAGVLGLTAAVMLQVYGPVPRFVPPTQQLMPQGGFTLGDVVVDYQRAAIFVVSVVLVGALALLLRHTWFGLGIQCASQNNESARLVGVRPIATARFNWALAGALSGIAGVLVAPILAVNIGTYAYLLVVAVGASLIGGLASLPITFVAGVALGMIEAATPYFWGATGSGAVAIGFVVVVALYRNRSRFRIDDTTQAATGRTKHHGPVAVAAARTIVTVSEAIRTLPRGLFTVVLAAVALYLPLTDTYYGAVGVNVLFNALLALSLLVALGIAGRPSLMQIGLAGIAAYSVATGVSHGLDYVVAAALAVAITGVVGSALGAIALRFHGVEFAIATLTFGAAISAFVLEWPSLSNTLLTPTAFGMDLLDSGNAFKFLGVISVAAFWVVRNFRRSSLGRSLTAGADKESLLEHFGMDAYRAELAAFALASVIAGAAGVGYTLVVNSFTTFQFTPVTSIVMVLGALVGGLYSLWGPIVAGVLLGYGPTAFEFIHSRDANAIPQLVTSLFALMVIVKLPGGVTSLGSWATGVVDALPAGSARYRLRGVDLRREHVVSGNGTAAGSGINPDELGRAFESTADTNQRAFAGVAGSAIDGARDGRSKK